MTPNNTKLGGHAASSIPERAKSAPLARFGLFLSRAGKDEGVVERLTDPCPGCEQEIPANQFCKSCECYGWEHSIISLEQARDWYADCGPDPLRHLEPRKAA